MEIKIKSSSHIKIKVKTVLLQQNINSLDIK